MRAEKQIVLQTPSLLSIISLKDFFQFECLRDSSSDCRKYSFLSFKRITAREAEIKNEIELVQRSFSNTQSSCARRYCMEVTAISL